jgi:hypothetical protein
MGMGGGVAVIAVAVLTHHIIRERGEERRERE